MICQRQMASFRNEDLTTRTLRTIEMNPLFNRRLKLPPISSKRNLVEAGNRPSSNVAFFSDENGSMRLPRLDLCPLGLDRYKDRVASGDKTVETTPMDTDDAGFPCRRVYSVLPPIGKRLTPSAPQRDRETRTSECAKDNSQTDIRRRAHASRKHRIRKATGGACEATGPVASASVADADISTIHTQDIADQLPISPGEKIYIEISGEISETNPKSCSESGASAPDEKGFKTSNDSGPKSSSTSSGPDAELSHVPTKLRAYSDIYPPSPPPNDRRARNNVDKTRQMIAEENDLRLSFMKKFGKRRRDATCPELDEALKNAVNLLRDVFLRKTMEELCMLW